MTTFDDDDDDVVSSPRAALDICVREKCIEWKKKIASPTETRDNNNNNNNSSRQKGARARFVVVVFVEVAPLGGGVKGLSFAL